MHKIIEASETLDGKLALTIEWADGTETREIVSENAARGLGYHYPDEPAPADDPCIIVEPIGEDVGHVSIFALAGGAS